MPIEPDKHFEKFERCLVITVWVVVIGKEKPHIKDCFVAGSLAGRQGQSLLKFFKRLIEVLLSKKFLTETKVFFSSGMLWCLSPCLSLHRLLRSSRLLFFFKALSLNRRHKFDLIHDYSSSPLLVGLTGILGKLCGAKTLHTLCVVNEGLLGSAKLTFGFSWVDKVIVTAPNLLPSKKNIEYLPLGIDTEKFKPHQKEFQKTILF